jgi:hypothetical protein
MLRESEPLGIEVVDAVRRGDGGSLRHLLATNPALAREYIESADGSSRTLLHVVTDWPGFFPHGPVIARLLIEAGADPDARTRGAGFAEASLHRTASSNDVEVAAVLIDAGADIELAEGSIGTPLDNAIGYGCWNVARLLVSRGARVDKLWHAAALGVHDRLIDLLGESPPSEGTLSEEALSEAFFLACSGGRRRAAELLLARAVDVNAAPGHGDSPLEAAPGLGAQCEQLVEWLRTHGAQPPGGSLLGGSPFAALDLAS